MEKILTVSVATYNLGKMIEDNLKSFVKLKNIKDVEVLVIDDGSTDNTAEIANKYHKMYPESIKIIKQKNAGPGSTVNTGIKNATGKYFKMVDGDDWINSIALDQLIESLKNTETVDAIITNDIVYSDCEKKIINNIKFDYVEETIFQDLKINNPIIGMHSIAYRTEILKENNITLDNGFYTDVEFLLYPLPFVKKIVYYNLDIYVYRVGREGQSVSYKSLKKNVKMHDLVLNNIINYYQEHKNTMSEGNSKFMSKRISDMILTKLNLILAFEKNSTVRTKVKKFITNLKNNYIDLYKMCLSTYKAKLIVYSNFYFSIILAMILKQKIKKEL